MKISKVKINPAVSLDTGVILRSTEFYACNWSMHKDKYYVKGVLSFLKFLTHVTKVWLLFGAS